MHQLCETDIIIPILWMRKLRLRDSMLSGIRTQVGLTVLSNFYPTLHPAHKSNSKIHIPGGPNCLHLQTVRRVACQHTNDWLDCDKPVRATEQMRVYWCSKRQEQPIIRIHTSHLWCKWNTDLNSLTQQWCWM